MKKYLVLLFISLALSVLQGITNADPYNDDIVNPTAIREYAISTLEKTQETTTQGKKPAPVPAARKQLREQSSTNEKSPATVKTKVIGNRDSKRYHLPGMKYYNAVEAHHRVEFDSEADAIKAGYFKASR